MCPHILSDAGKMGQQGRHPFFFLVRFQEILRFQVTIEILGNLEEVMLAAEYNEEELEE